MHFLQSIIITKNEEIQAPMPNRMKLRNGVGHNLCNQTSQILFYDAFYSPMFLRNIKMTPVILQTIISNQVRDNFMPQTTV